MTVSLWIRLVDFNSDTDSGNYMEDALLKYMDRIVSLSEEEKNALSVSVECMAFKKKELFVKSGDVCSKVLFFNKGYFRFYHLNDSGDEVTSDFYFAPGFITSYTSLVTGNPSFVNVQAMVDMDVLVLKRSSLYSLYYHYRNFEHLGRIVAENVAINSERHLFMLLNQTAEKRYKDLLDKAPEYVKTIPLQYIASYLGITKETLSRIRKSIF